MQASDEKPAADFSFVIDVNNPSLQGTSLVDKIKVKTSRNGEFLIKGLPMGTYMAVLSTPNAQSAVAYFDELPKKCEWLIKKQKQSSSAWTVSKNTCGSLKAGAR